MHDQIRNIVVPVAGTDEEYQASVLSGITEAAKKMNFNVSVFASFGGVLANQQYDDGEYNIYSLINFKKFDGAILLTNTICHAESRERIAQELLQAGIPTAVLDSSDYPDFYNIRIDNTAAMREIVEHVVEKHGAKTINYISGPLENPEARERYQAFLDVMAEHQLPVEERRIYFGEFRPIDGKRAAEAIFRSGMKLPDAIIAANDAMALEAISALHAHGIRVPEDVIVTGFDYTYYAKHHNPSLTSVSRPLAEAGKIACEVLAKIFNGEECEKTVTLNASSVFGESCGCSSIDEIDIRSYKTETYNMLRRFRSGTSLLNRLTSALALDETPADDIHTISQYLHEIGCEQCCICLCENWENAFHEGGSRKERYQVHGYTENMSAPLIWTDGRIAMQPRFKSADMFPNPPEDGGNVSYFFPMHFRDRCLGYYIFSNTEFPIRSMLCHSLMMNISHSFENIRKLLHLNNALNELDRLYVIDPLCCIYNRNGFIRLADQIFKHCCIDHDSIMISFIDMDGLKYINDNFGHDEGDFALQRLASAINDACFGNQICARFGGDEFIVVGSGFSKCQANEFETTIYRRLGEINAAIMKPYIISASIGTFVTDVTEDMKLFSLIAEADQIMYEHKKRKRPSRYLRQG